MGEGEPGSVQGLAGEIEQPAAQRFGEGAGDGGDAPEIERVTDDGMAAGTEVDADLVGAAGGESALE